MLNLDWNIIWTVLNLLVLYLLLKHFLFGPVTRMMEQRQKDIGDSIRDAEDMKRKAAQLADEYEQRLDAAQQKAAQVMEEGKKRAARQAEIIIEAAHDDAAKIIQEARAQALREQEKMQEAMRENVAELVLLTASRLIGEKMDDTADHALVESLLARELTKS